MAQLRKGVTLVEMLVALSLSVILIGAITGTLRSLVQQRRRLSVANDDWKARFHRMLWLDLSQARLVAKLESGIAFALIDDSVVTYELVRKNPSDCELVRATFSFDREVSTGETLLEFPNLTPFDRRTIVWSISSIDFLRGDANGLIQPIPRTWSPAPMSIQYRLMRLDDAVDSMHWITVR